MVMIKGQKMTAKKKPPKIVKPQRQQVCCSLLKKLEPDIETYIQDLIRAEDDSNKMRWAWAVITIARQITEIKTAKKGKSVLCPKCKLYLEPRRRLAELVIQGCRCYS